MTWGAILYITAEKYLGEPTLVFKEEGIWVKYGVKESNYSPPPYYLLQRSEQQGWNSILSYP